MNSNRCPASARNRREAKCDVTRSKHDNKPIAFGQLTIEADLRRAQIIAALKSLDPSAAIPPARRWADWGTA